ncbi:MAG: 6-phosphogluconate dehydrogenase [Clostridia bacterium]|nr:6-phosphogluconate dehydrogenase [Clostridia bacterium]
MNQAAIIIKGVKFMKKPILGFIGFGEAAYCICSGLRSESNPEINAFDVMANSETLGPTIQKRAQDASVTLCSTLKELLEKSDIVFCATSAKYALPIATEAAQNIRKGCMYADMNSASPMVKREIAQVIDKTGAFFVDAAVMELVPPHKHKVPIAASGTGAAQFTEYLNSYGMNVSYINDQAGSSSSMKMFRSIFMKGLTSLLLETLVASYKMGIDKEIIESINNTLSKSSVEKLANLLINRTSIGAERRVSEMGDVISTLTDMGLDATASKATKQKLQSLVDINLKEHFNNTVPEHYTQVLKAILEKSIK